MNECSFALRYVRNQRAMAKIILLTAQMGEEVVIQRQTPITHLLHTLF